MDSWDASNQVRALRSGEAELYGIVDGSARGIFTKHMYEEMGRTINIDVATDSTAATGMCCQTGVGKTRHIHVRWLWIQDAIRDLREVRGTDNEADMNQRPRRTDTSALLAETAAQANPVQTAPRLDRDSKRRERCGSADEWKLRKRWEVFSTSDDRDTNSIGDVGPDGSLEATFLGKTVERGARTGFNPVNQIMVPTNVYCSPGGECYHTSRKCEGFKNVPMDAR